jgi:predicted transcriptional regulator
MKCRSSLEITRDMLHTVVDSRCTLTQLVCRANLNHTFAFRYLVELERAGYVRVINGNGGARVYELTPKGARYLAKIGSLIF